MRVTKKDLRVNRRRITEVNLISDGSLLVAGSSGSVIFTAVEKRALVKVLSKEEKIAMDKILKLEA